MAEPIVIVAADDKDWRHVSPSWAGKVEDGEPDVIYKELIEPGAQCPRVQLVHYEPHHYEKRHSHQVAEYLYIMNGELELGDRRVGARTLIFVDKNTVYGPIKAGPDGTDFLRVEIA